MINKTELIFLDYDEESHSIDGLLNVKVDDEFYYSISKPHPKAIDEYKEKNKNGELLEGFSFNENFIDSFIDGINETCDKYHIHLLKVVKVTKSLDKDYSVSISNPKITFTETISVVII